MIYLYRLGPITDRNGPGRAKNLMKYAEPIDEDRIMKEFGSGRYRADCVYQPATGKPHAYRFQFPFDIMNPDYPPKIPAGDWVDDPRNKEWEWCREKVVSGSDGPSANQLADATLKLLREIKPNLSGQEHNALSSQIVSLVKDSQEQMRALMDPQKQLNLVTSLIALLPKVPEPKADTTNDRLITMLMDDRKAMRDELRQLREQISGNKEKSLLDQLTELEPVIDRLSGGRRQSNSVADNGWLQFGQVALEKLGGPIGMIAQALVLRNGGRQQPQPQPGGPQNAAQRRSGHVTAASPQQPEPPPAAAVAAPSPTVQQQPQYEPAVPMSEEEKAAVMGLYMEFGGLIASCAPILVDHFQNGLDGYEFRDWFLSRKGLECWNAVRTKVGIDNLVNFAKFDQGLWNALQPEEQFRAFLGQFFTPVGEEEDNETPAFVEQQNRDYMKEPA